MKSTAQRLNESYCRPITEEECNLLGISYEHAGTKVCVGWKNMLVRYVDDNRTEIPASQFIDLVHDQIAPWRLEDDGFHQVTPYGETKMYYFDFVTITIESNNVHVTIPDRLAAFGVRKCKVTTYTQLLTLIELIG